MEEEEEEERVPSVGPVRSRGRMGMEVRRGRGGGRGRIGGWRRWGIELGRGSWNGECIPKLLDAWEDAREVMGWFGRVESMLLGCVTKK